MKLLARNVKIIAEGLARHIYNISEVVSVAPATREGWEEHLHSKTLYKLMDSTLSTSCALVPATVSFIQLLSIIPLHIRTLGHPLFPS